MSTLQTTESRFRNLTGLLRDDYLSDPINLVQTHGTETMQRLKMATKLIHQRDNYIDYITAAPDNTNMSRDLLKDYEAPSEHKTGKINYRYDPYNPASNDFRGIDGVARLSVADLERRGNSTSGMIDLAKMITKSVFDALNEKPSMYMHSSGSNQLGAVSGTKVNPTTDFANGSTYTAGSTQATFLVTGFSIGVFRRGQLIDIYNGSSLVLNNLMIRHVDYDQGALTVERTNATVAANLDNITSGYLIYRTGDINSGFQTSFGEVFPETVASNDDWVGGINRSEVDNFHFLPIMLRRGAASAEIPDESHLNDLGQALGYAKKGSREHPRTFFGGAALMRRFRQEVGDRTLVVAGNNSNQSHTIGNTSLVYEDVTLGHVELVADHTARNDRLIFVDTNDLKMLRAGIEDLYIPTRNGDTGYFERMSGTNAARGGSKVYKMECSTWMLPAWDRFDNAACIFGLTAA